MIARSRCGNEEERNGFWKIEEEKDAVYMEEKCIEHIMIHTRIKIGVGVVLEREGGILKWIREVKKLREIHRRGIESVRECECG